MSTNIIKNRFNLTRAIIRSTQLHKGVPQEIIVEVTNRCNLHCPMCVRTHRKINEKDLTKDEFSLLLDNIPDNTERVAIAGLGEPLLNPNIIDIVHHCTKKGFDSVLYTNATLLDLNISAELLRAGLGSIIISFDGTTDTSYEYYRRGANFDRVKANILNFLKIKQELNSKVFVEMQMIVLKHTFPEVKKFLHMWSIDGVDSIRVKNDHMGVLKEDFDKSSSFLKGKKGLCAMPWRGPATINVQGELYPCCVASEYNVMLGNVFEHKLEELWHSDLANKLRKNFLNHRSKLPSCRYCNIPFIPLFFVAGGTMVNPSFAHKILTVAERMRMLNLRRLLKQ